MTLVTLILVTLATFRAAYLVVYEDGPWNVATRLRSWVTNRYGLRSWQHTGINCMLCVSFWLALPWAAGAVWLTGAAWASVVLLWWGAAGGVLTVHALVTRGR